jgi:predicted nucleic-acid-binding Zn-ribbon protein
MMKKCPECGSTEIVSDLIVFAGDAPLGRDPIHVSLNEPEPAKRPFVWVPKSVTAGFRAAVCGACGHTQFYTKHHAEILDAHKKGYTGQKYDMTSVST